MEWQSGPSVSAGTHCCPHTLLHPWMYPHFWDVPSQGNPKPSGHTGAVQPPRDHSQHLEGFKSPQSAV